MKNFEWNNHDTHNNSCTLLDNNLHLPGIILCIIGGFFLSSAIFTLLGAALFAVPMFLRLMLFIVCSFLLGFLFD